MKSPNRDLAVFGTSAIDLFASALGAFILLMMVLFPFYRNAGPQDAYSKTRELVEQRREAAGDLRDREAERDRLQTELERQEAENRQREAQVRTLHERLDQLERQIAELPVPVPDPESLEIEPEPMVTIADGVEFSILGLASESKSFVIVVDMSGSMINYEDLMLSALLDILKPLDEDNEFAIIGYQGNPEPVLWRYPGERQMLTATPENLRQAREYSRGLSQKFVGSTPTHYALQAALEYPASAIILLSDGEPNSPPGYIIETISNLNQFRQTELHTVAIGAYTRNRNLVLFLQTLSRMNNGDFVGVSR